LLAGPGGAGAGELRVPEGRFALGTVCSVAINGVLLSHGIATVSKFGGLLQLEEGKPKRFTEIIYYEGTTLDPLEIFIKGHMTSVKEAARTGNGIIGASFREVPAEATEEVKRIARRLDQAGLGAIMLIGRPHQPVLGIPVTPGRTGLVVAGGLNPLAAVEESGIATRNMAMAALCPFDRLGPYEVLAELAGR
jgi:repressor of nif and glnA expression